ncbi:NAD-dependent epimerase/dehydratase family protein [Tropicibacter naphthalenivorans]|uniref:NAD-dependent epimerase/dehydratase family protein n=1 Tax=Tropicibacter naphthalenivorans TaxID=441103 RepID=UPI0013562DB5|nr:NAD-dependent epimerase/dehydratase family protein [Tropicibacter naphthalenivorans]
MSDTTDATQTRVYVLGASGKVGRLLRAVWRAGQANGLEFIPIFRQTPEDAEGLQWRPEQDLPNVPKARAVLALWGVTGADPAALQQNVDLAIRAQEFGQSVGADRVLHCSSAAVYRPEDHPLGEAARLDPPTPYGAAKLAMERALQDAPGPTPVILRIGSVAGAESLFGNMRPGGSIHLHRFADGQGPSRSYIAPQDLARVIHALITSPEARGIYNVGAPKGVRMQDLAQAAACQITWAQPPKGVPQNVVLDTTRLQGLCALGAGASDARQIIADVKATRVWP